MPAKQLLIYATLCDQMYTAARMRKDYFYITNSGAICAISQLEYSTKVNQYGELANPHYMKVLLIGLRALRATGSWSTLPVYSGVAAAGARRLRTLP